MICVCSRRGRFVVLRVPRHYLAAFSAVDFSGVPLLNPPALMRRGGLIKQIVPLDRYRPEMYEAHRRLLGERRDRTTEEQASTPETG